MESNSAAKKACLDLIQLAPPAEAEKTFSNINQLASSNKELHHELLQQIHLPLKLSTDSNADGKSFLQCPFNRVGDSYRSPWSNTYHPPLADSSQVDDMPESLRNLELAFSEVWEAYLQHYYGTEASVGSVYVCEQESESFVACFLLQKKVQTVGTLEQGQWDSAHVCRVDSVKGGSAEYRLESTVLVTMTPSKSPDDASHSSETTLSSRMSKETTQSAVVAGDYSHLETIGKMIEDTEIELRSNLDTLHIPKTRQVVESIRKESKPPRPGGMNPMMNHTAMLNQAVLARAAMNKKASS